MKYQKLYHISSQVKLVLEGENFNSKSFKDFTKIISSKDNINTFYEFFMQLLLIQDNSIFELDNIKVKKFLSIYVLIFYPEINNVSSKNETCQNLLKTSKLLQFNLKMLVKFCQNKLLEEDIEKQDCFINGFKPSIKSFFIKFHNYLELFDSWKRIDIEHLIFNLSYDYYNIEKKIKEQKGVLLFQEIKSIFVIEKNKIKRHVRELDQLNGILKFNEYLDIIEEYESENGDIQNRDKIFALKISKTMNYNLKKAYWDLLEDEFECGIYNKLEKSIFELKELIKSCVPNKKEVHLELDEFLDEKFIIQKIEKKVFTIAELTKLFDYILTKLETYQSEFEDEYTLEFREELEDLLLKNDFLYSSGFIIRFFLEWIFPKFSNILQFREYLETQIQKN